MEENIEYLNSKFQNYNRTHSIHKSEHSYSWNLLDWSYYGYSYGISLRIRKDRWIMKQMLESGYTPGKVLMDTDRFEDLEPWLDVLAPTNPNFKTDRK